MNNPKQLNYTQQLEHRLAMIKEDIEILKKFIIREGLSDILFAYCNVSNIEIACDIKDDESISWGMYK